MIQDLEVQYDLIEALVDVLVQLEVIFREFVVELKETTEYSEARVFFLVPEDGANELGELLITNIFETIAILKLFVYPFAKVSANRKTRTFAFLQPLFSGINYINAFLSRPDEAYPRRLLIWAVGV